MNYLKRLALYVAGLMILAFGVAFSIRSNLGVSPVSSIPSTLNLITGLSVGTLTFLFYSFCVLLQIILLKRDFKVKNLLQVIFSSVLGVFMDFSLNVTKGFVPPNYLIQVMFLLVSLLLIGVGVFLLVITDIIYNAPEGLCMAISTKFNLEFASVKGKFDIACVLISLSLSLIFLGNLGLIREGTVIAALSIGKIVGFFMRRFGKRIVLLYS